MKYADTNTLFKILIWLFSWDGRRMSFAVWRSHKCIYKALFCKYSIAIKMKFEWSYHEQEQSSFFREGNITSINTRNI